MSSAGPPTGRRVRPRHRPQGALAYSPAGVVRRRRYVLEVAHGHSRLVGIGSCSYVPWIVASGSRSKWGDCDSWRDFAGLPSVKAKRCVQGRSRRIGGSGRHDGRARWVECCGEKRAGDALAEVWRVHLEPVDVDDPVSSHVTGRHADEHAVDKHAAPDQLGSLQIYNAHVPICRGRRLSVSVSIPSMRTVHFSRCLRTVG